MGTRAPLAPQEFYHVYNRGTEKRTIFTSKKEYERFIALLYVSNSNTPIHLSNHQGSTLPELLEIARGEPLVDIVAYCLMPNHFHLLLRQHLDGGISSFMQKLSTGYTMYFNLLHDRSGALFQGKFKSSRASDDNYLKYLTAYNHLNPLKLFDPNWKERKTFSKKGAWEHLEHYRHSSCPDYLGVTRPENKILDTGALPLYFESPAAWKKDLVEWITGDEGNGKWQGSTLTFRGISRWS